MGRFFTRERFGRPQVLAGTLLLIFLAQCAWLVNRSRSVMPEAHEIFRIHEGLGQWRGEWIASTPSAARTQQSVGDEPYDSHHSALWYLIASAPSLLWPRNTANYPYWGWLAHAPYLIFGVLLGASWGAFGAIFTAIAVAHTLYAPREVVLWNWRRILLLGLSLALAVGSQFSLVVVLPVTLAFMLYVVPGRRTAAAVIWAAAVGIGTLILFASYFFHAGAFWQGMRHASFLGISGSALLTPLSYKRVVAQLGQSSPALVLALPFALAIWAGWRRARYFGNTAPLLMAVLLLLFAVGTPHYPGLGFQLVAVPFLFVFVSGIAADLLESRHKNLVTACVWGLLVANAAWNTWELARAGPRSEGETSDRLPLMKLGGDSEPQEPFFSRQHA